MKSSGKSSPKVFQLKEDNFKPGDYLISRKHHPGQHQLSIVVNGVELAKAAFELGPQSA